MDVSEVSRERNHPNPAIAHGEPACPGCGEPLHTPPPQDAAALGHVAVRRCARCGTRSAAGVDPRLVFSCERCGVPFLASELLAHGRRLCGSCREGQIPPGLPDPLVVRATESEVRAALATRWRFVTAAALSDYLDRVARHLARAVENAPGSARVRLVEEASFRTLALPSGALLVSTGTLAFLEDEAELVFVLGHELAHAASGDAAVRLLRMGFDAVARGNEAPAPAAWAEAAQDLVKLGYGRDRERDADARALQAMLSLDYDPESAVRYLKRLNAAIEQGDPRCAEVAVAHPLPTDRIRRLERALWDRVPEGRILRVNREVFRRAVTRESLTAGLSPIAVSVEASFAAPDAEEVPAGPRRRRLWLVAVVGAAILAALGGMLLLVR